MTALVLVAVVDGGLWMLDCMNEAMPSTMSLNTLVECSCMS